MKKVFLVGIGGIGISALAKYLFLNGYQILGSDEVKNENIDDLIKNYNLKFFQGHKKENFLEDIEFLIYSPAVNENNPERKKAKDLGIQEFSYPEFLGKISKEKYTISIAGTNGKTTSSTMLAEVLDYFQKDPTVVVGGIARKFNSNFLAGKSDLFLVESCEYKGSFLNLRPNIILITNITPDHLDYFDNFQNYQKVFQDFLTRVKGDKKILVCNKNNENLKPIVEKAEELGFKIIDYKKYKIERVAIPGEYNRENAQGVLAIADVWGLDLKKVENYLSKDFVGSGRRFEFLGKTTNGIEIYDDYAHNPEALNSLLLGIKEKFPDKKNIIIFQPHLFSRTEDFFDDFVQSLSGFDIIYLLSIYRARENPEDFSISSEKLFREIKKNNKNTFFCQDFEDCQKKIEEKHYNDDFVLFTVGAGEADEVGKSLLK